ncbi:MAG: A/G-specific adenine glycosylase [Phycisphaerales bacterium JB040]
MASDQTIEVPPPGAWAEAGLDPHDVAVSVEGWFEANARLLPWRPNWDGGSIRGERDPWRALVSEAMLQQTQVSRVVRRFEAFIAAFPTPRAMADAGEDAVVAAWAGMGYYRRARNLYRAAVMICEEHGGEVPREEAALRALPGVGRYTAGAIASMVYGRCAPIVDGNVSRVLLRLFARDGAAGERETDTWAWERAEELVGAADEPGLLNEGVMELGATVCLPGRGFGGARCEDCPLREVCRARAEHRVGEIPRPKARSGRVVIHAAAVVCVDKEGRVLLERRPEHGLWAGMWQAPTLEGVEVAEPEDVLAFSRGQMVDRIGLFTHATTHREVRFSVWHAEGMRASKSRVRVGLEEALSGKSGLALSNAAKRCLRVWSKKKG